MNTDNSEPTPSPEGSPATGRGEESPNLPKEPPPKYTAREIEQWFVDYLTNLPERNSTEEVDVTVPFESFALDSITAVGMTGDLEEWLGRSVDPTMVYDYPTIEQFSRYLAEQNDV